MRHIAFRALPILLLASPLFAADPSPVKLAALTTEHLQNPIGIGNEKPRLSWKLQSQRPGEMQTAYEIRANPNPAVFTALPGAKIFWESGKVSSDQSVLVPWAGPPLAPRSQIFWQVRVWDKNDQPSAWSDTASFELNKLTPALTREIWKGQWITADLPRFDIMQNPLAKANWISAGSLPTQAAGVRTIITIPPGAKVLAATVDAAADGLISLYINGQPTKQGSSSHTAPFHADFPTQLSPGKNSIAIGAIAVRNARGPTAQGKNAIAAHAVIDLDNGQHIDLFTDGSWKAAVAPPANWFAADFDDSAWAAATLQGAYEVPPRPSADSTVGPGRYLRKTFTVKPGAIAKARLYSTALGVYEASINGRPINDHLLEPGWTDYNQKVMVQTTDVTSLLTPGQNTVGALLSDGWFAGRVGWAGLKQYSGIADHPSFNAQLEITYADGTTDLIPTDSSWKGGAGEIVGSDQQLGEVIDARKAVDWNLPTFNDAAWTPALVEQHEPVALTAQVGPPVRKLMDLTAKKVSRIGNTWIVDFGQNTVGHVRLTARGPSGTTITVTHGEMLNADGTVYTENLRPAISLDTFTLKGASAAETFEPHFTFHGFRYAQITGYPGDLSADNIQAVVIGSDTPMTGTFESSNADVNRLYQNILWGQRSNFISVPTDCPQRDERMGWMGDAQVFSATAAQNANVAGFFTKWMIDINDAQTPEGAFNNVSPKARETQSYPVWGDAGVVIPWVMYTTYGDKAFLEDNYEHMARWVDYEHNRYPNLMPTGGVGDHLAPAGGRGGAGGPAGGRGPAAAPGRGAPPAGNAPGTGRQGVSAPRNSLFEDGFFTVAAPPAPAARGAAPGTAPAARGGAGRAGRGGPGGFGGGVNTTTIVDTAYFAHSAQIVSKAAAILGKPDDAKKYDQLYHDICDAFTKTFVQPDGSMLAGTQTTYILALQFGLVPDNLRPGIIKHLTDDIEARDHLTTGFVGVGQINPALSAIGRSDLAYKLLLTDTYPSWLFTVKQGATTMWERWDGYTPERGFQDSSMNSFNHYSFGSVGLWFYNGMGGIQADEKSPGYKHFTLNPQIAPPSTKITYVKTSLNTAYGLITSNWHIDNGQVTYDATVPPNTTATLIIPSETAPKSLEPGTYHFTFPQSAVK